MEQMIFPPPYRYIIDTCSLFEQTADRKYNRAIHKTLWSKIEQLIKSKQIVVCTDISNEIKKNEELGEDYLVNKQCEVLEATQNIQDKVIEIVNKYPEMLKFKEGPGQSSGDAFLIATAIVYKLTIITEENPKKIGKIPDIASKCGVEVVNINGLCGKEKWEF